MKRINFCFIIAIISAVVLSGCVSFSTSVTDQQITPQGEEATITFFRSSYLGFLTTCLVVEETNHDDVKLVASLDPGEKIRNIVAPGKHVFLVEGESPDLLEVNVAPKMNYYVRVSPRLGFMQRRYKFIALSPEKLSTKNIQNEINVCSLAEPNDRAKKYFQISKDIYKKALQDIKNTSLKNLKTY